MKDECFADSSIVPSIFILRRVVFVGSSFCSSEHFIVFTGQELCRSEHSILFDEHAVVSAEHSIVFTVHSVVFIIT